MRTIVMALKSLGYKKTVKLLSVEETIEWNRMVSEAVMGQLRPILAEEDNLQWHCMIIEEELNSSISIR